MSRRFVIAARPLSEDLSAVEAASILTRALRAHDRALRNEHITQLPLLDGGEGSLEHLVTMTLGSFLEVEATGGDGEPVIAPFGLLGEESKTAFISLQSVAAASRHTAPQKRSRKGPAVPTTGTTYGIGELIQDCMDEGAFSVMLGWEEPLVRDAGLGAAAALGVKFLDKKGAVLDLAKPIPDLYSQIERVDVSGKPFQLLSSRIYLARTEKLKHAGSERQSSMEETLLESELERLREIIKGDAGVTIDLSKIDMSNSAVDFGLIGLLGAQVMDGAKLMFEAAQVPETLKQPKTEVVAVAQRLEDIYGSRSSAAAQELLNEVKQNELPLRVILTTTPSPQLLGRFRRSVRSVADVMTLADSTLFLPPSGSPSETKQDVIMRLESLAQRLYEGSPVESAAS